MIDFLPWREWNPFERVMTNVFRRFYNRSWLDAVTGRRQHFGVRGFIPYARPVPEALGRPTVDFIGLNYYMKVYVCCGLGAQTAASPSHGHFPPPGRFPLGIAFSKHTDTVSDLGWAVHPRGLGRLLRFVRRYGLPILITENGIADRNDELRADYLRWHLDEVAAAMAAGVDVRGYYHWSLLDNFEWIKGFGPRFGLYEVDYATLERRRRPSAETYRMRIRSALNPLKPNPILTNS
jgi:beta-glucosidase